MRAAPVSYTHLWEAPALLALPPSEWPEGAHEAITRTLKHVCDGDTQAEWMKELGLIKRGAGKLRGGDTSGKAKKLTPEEELAAMEKALREDALAPFQAFDAMGEAWRVLNDAELESGIEKAREWADKAAKWLKTPKNKRPALNVQKAFLKEEEE